ncbi:MAG TPA: hypothetical protein VGD73_09330 [Pseudonocardia sp.]|uniref:hypothetical protein n=1 Tax=Pseudonocardia sp. TaxID=60912 RepID=UPI002ED99121
MTQRQRTPMPVRRRWPLRVLAGLVLLVAVGLLWPFAGWSWWPWVGGLGVLILLYLLRLDRLLFGWAPHLAGLVTVVLMAARSDPWAWGLAGGIAVLGVGVARLPDRRLLVVGAGLVLLFGLGYGVAHFRTAQQRQAEQAQESARQASNVMAIAPELLLRAVARGIAAGDARTTCDLLGSPASDQLAGSVGTPDCAAAVRQLATQVRDPGAYASPLLPPTALAKQPGATGQSGTATLDGCQAKWPGPDPGPKLGRFSLRQFQQSDRYLVTGYSSCR